MDALITSLGFDAAEFRTRLAEANGIVAGSSVLAEFLRANGQDPGYEPGDMDIWIYRPSSQPLSNYLVDKALERTDLDIEAEEEKEKEIIRKRFEAIESAYRDVGERLESLGGMPAIINTSFSNQATSFAELTEELLAEANGLCYDIRRASSQTELRKRAARSYCYDKYMDFLKYLRSPTRSCLELAPEGYYSGMSNSISTVYDYNMNTGKRMQVIVVNGHAGGPLSDYIKRDFDLSCCMAYWDPATGAIKHHYPEFTLKRRTVCIKPEITPKVRERIMKYEARGFTLCDTMEEPPTFAADSKWQTTICTDILTFDEQPVAAYLATAGHIVIQSGENFYGFKRKEFIKYLRDHPVKFNGYKTPLGHIVSLRDIEKVSNITSYIFCAVPVLICGHNITNILEVLAV